MKKRVCAFIIVFGVIALLFASPWVGLVCTELFWTTPTHKLAEYNGGIRSYTCTLPKSGAAWFLNFAGNDLLEGKNQDVEVTLINSGEANIYINNDQSASSQGGSTVAPLKKFTVYKGNLDTLIGPGLYVMPSLNNDSGPLHFILQMKTKGDLASPVWVTASAPDGL